MRSYAAVPVLKDVLVAEILGVVTTYYTFANGVTVNGIDVDSSGSLYVVQSYAVYGIAPG